jgi:hypothetical protein
MSTVSTKGIFGGGRGSWVRLLMVFLEDIDGKRIIKALERERSVNASTV